MHQQRSTKEILQLRQKVKSLSQEKNKLQSQLRSYEDDPPGDEQAKATLQTELLKQTNTNAQLKVHCVLAAFPCALHSVANRCCLHL